MYCCAILKNMKPFTFEWIFNATSERKMWNLLNWLYARALKKSQLNATDVWACKKYNNFHMLLRVLMVCGKVHMIRNNHRLSLAVVVIIVNIFISHYPLNSICSFARVGGWGVDVDEFQSIFRENKIFIAMICQFCCRS